MRQILILSVLLLGLSWAVAQNSPASAGQKASPSADAGSQTVEGCLSGSAGKFTLTDAEGKTFELTGDTSKLTEHVGHEVKITGKSGSAAGGTATGGGSQSLEVSSVKHVAKTCKSPGGMAK